MSQLLQPPSGGCVLKLYVLLAHKLTHASSHLRVAVCWNVKTLKTKNGLRKAATFGWLCVETKNLLAVAVQTDSSHLRVAVCWNRPNARTKNRSQTAATFGWLCVETQQQLLPKVKKRSSHLRVAVCWNIDWIFAFVNQRWQPPSGGCVLKHFYGRGDAQWSEAATFGWLCVETISKPSFATSWPSSHLRVAVCWNTAIGEYVSLRVGSHLRVAVCWNTGKNSGAKNKNRQPPSGGCVLKPVNCDFGIAPTIAATFGRLCVETISHNYILIAKWAATFGWLCVETPQSDIYALGVLQPPSGGCVLKHFYWTNHAACTGSRLQAACVLKPKY